MNPLEDFRVEKFKQVLHEIETIGRIEQLRQLEDQMIDEIVKLIQLETKEAKEELRRIDKIVKEELHFVPKNKLLISALKNSIIGALKAAHLFL